MKYFVAVLIALLVGLGCKEADKNRGSHETLEYFDLSGAIKKELDSIQKVGELIINLPNNQEDYDKNDSITLIVSEHTNTIINLLIESHGKVPTDTILTILENLDNSGYIPIALHERLNKEDFSTEIGQRARKSYQQFLDSKKEEVKSLKNINLLSEGLQLNRIVEDDTIALKDLLLEHKGYKVLDFWATWCAPCRSFNRGFQNHYSAYKDKGIEFYGIGIRVDNVNEREKFLTALKNDKTPWKQFIDLNNGTYRLFETNAVPYQVLLNKDNQVIKILSHDITNDLDEFLRNQEH